MTNSKQSSSRLFSVEKETTKLLCEVVDTPRSLAVFMLLDADEIGQYLELSIDANAYEDPQKFADDYLVSEVLRKSPNLPLQIDKREVARLAFMGTEASCTETNERFSLGVPERNHPVWLFEVRREFQRILGHLDSETLDRINFRHGPGATTATGGRGSVPSEKYTEALHLTANLIPFYKTILGPLWHYCQRKPAIVVQGSKFTTVPKSAKTDRGICTEPTLNMYVQLGIGQIIRRRLCKLGVDLNSQKKNQLLARQAYSSGLATIDLSAASDSVSWKLVQYLADDYWTHLFGVARSPATSIEGERHVLAKISSMGNGFTFELETAIFYACMRVAVPRHEWNRMNVYGDDIIVPRAYATVLIKMLNYLGFSVNSSKSFLAGNFFESCGHDFFRGVPCRPCYFKGPKDGIPYEVQLANKVRLYAKLRGEHACDSRFRSVWVSLVKRCPRRWRQCRVPEQLGDVGLITSFAECRSRRKTTDGTEGWLVEAILRKPVQVPTSNFGLMLARLASIRGPSQIKEQRLNNKVKYLPVGELSSSSFHGKRKNPTYRGLEMFPSNYQVVKGYLGEVRTKWVSISYWSSSLDWDDKS